MTAAVTAPELVHKLVLGCTHFGGEGIERPAPGFQAAFSVEDAKRMGLQVRCKVCLRRLLYSIIRTPYSPRGYAEVVQKYTERLMAFNYTAKWVEANRSKFERICSDSFKTRRPMSVVGCQALGKSQHVPVQRRHSCSVPTRAQSCVLLSSPCRSHCRDPRHW